jgi:hypothetical protein
MNLMHIGKQDKYLREIYEGHRLSFKSRLYNKYFEGTVKYNNIVCGFIIERDNNEGMFCFTDIENIEIINKEELK